MRRTIIKGSVGAAVAAAIPWAHAQEYPNKPVRLLVGFPPGSTTDLVARIVAEGLRKRFGQPFVVENRPGANGTLAAEAVARAEPDGYTILVANTSSITVNPLLYKDIRYDVVKDFAPITTVVALPMILMVSTNHPKTGGVRTAKELAAVAKRQPQGLTYGSGGNGNLLHLAGAQLATLLNMNATHVPYRGAAPMQTALLGNEIDFAFNTLSAMPQIRAGILRALMVTSSERWPDLPDVPSATEEGLEAMNLPIWTGLIAPARTPQKIIDVFGAAVEGLRNDLVAREQLERQGRITTTTPRAFVSQIASELKTNAAVIKQADIRIE